MWFRRRYWVFRTDFEDVRLLRPRDPDWQNGLRYLTDPYFALSFVLELWRVDETYARNRFVELLDDIGLHGSGKAKEEVIEAVARLLVRDEIRFLRVEETDSAKTPKSVEPPIQEVAETAPAEPFVLPTALAVEVVDQDGQPLDAAATSSDAAADSTAELVWPAQDSEHKQYVNLDADADHPEQGHQIGIRVRLKDGKAGDKVFLKLAYDANQVSQRNAPKRVVVGGKLDASWCPQGGKEVVLADDAQEVTIPIDLGCAGGDEYIVHVGSTKACKDAKCTIVTWRRLWFEVMAPSFMGVSASGLPADIGARVDDLLRPCFIETELHKVHLFDETAAPSGNVYNKAYFGTDRQQFVLTDHDFCRAPATPTLTWDGGKRPRSLALRLCDRAFVSAGGVLRLAQFACEKTLRFNVYKDLGRFMLPLSAQDGSHAVRYIVWIAKASPSDNPAHPGVVPLSRMSSKQLQIARKTGVYSSAHRSAPRCGYLDPLQDVRYVDKSHFDVLLPEGTSEEPGPGRLAHHVLTSDQCPVLVQVGFDAADEVEGFASMGKRESEIAVVCGSGDPRHIGTAIVHEFCHRAGMAVIGDNRPPPGLAWPKTTAEADPDNEDAGSTLGHVYSGHGHDGRHCARGLTDDQKRQASYMGLLGTCVNFGAGAAGMPRAGSSGICPTCAKVLKARRLDSI